MTSLRPTAALSRAFSRAAEAFSSSAVSSSSSSSEAAAFPAKQVTKSNFSAALVELRRLVRTADFVAIDVEMTGITSAPWRECFEFDRSDVRYLKVKDSAEKFAVVQFGVVPFRWDSKSLSFVAYPHNFYVFPRQELSTMDNSSYEFLCQTASIDFLAQYQFDFNVCIREGISYLSRRQEGEIMGRLNVDHDDDSRNSKLESKDAPLVSMSDILSRNSKEKSKDVPLVNMADILFTERMKKRFSAWRDWLLQSGKSQFEGIQDDSRKQFHTCFFKMRPAIGLIGFTSKQLRLIQLVTRKNFEDLYYVHTNGESCESEHLLVYTDSEDDRTTLMNEVKEERREQAETKIQSAIGFRHVIDLLSSEQKLIVGHNCILDIAHVYSKFVGPLPSTAEEFVSSINKHFPHIIDTKILLNTHPGLRQRMKKAKTSLASAFTTLCPHLTLGFPNKSLPQNSLVNVEVEVDDTRSSKWNSGVKHEAGYDAFVTGCIFAQACRYTGVEFELRSESESLALHEKLQKHVNLLYLSWTNADIIDLRTGQKVAEPFETRKRYSKLVFENTVMIWGFPTKLMARDIKKSINEVFGLSSVTSIYLLDKTAVLVHFSRPELVSEFLELKERLERAPDPISRLNPVTEILEGGKTRAAGYETYKEICSSPLSKLLFADQAEALIGRQFDRTDENPLETLGDLCEDDEEGRVGVRGLRVLS